MHRGDAFCSFVIRRDQGDTQPADSPMTATLVSASRFDVPGDPGVVMDEPTPRVIGDYRVLGLIGSGAMGRVYLAHDDRLDRRVAIKVMSARYAGNATARQRFIRESRSLGSIEHPHVMAIHQVGEHEGVPYIVMQLLEGRTLRDHSDISGPLPLGEILRIGKEIASGLAAAHRRGILHRDIKPANVFLLRAPKANQPPRPKLVDFGLARPDDGPGGASFGDVGGTPGYMAPEQWHADGSIGVIGPATDIYGLGATLFFLLVGRAPVDAKGSRGAPSATLPFRPDWQAPARPPVPVDLRTIVEKCLRTSPLERYASAGELADDLDRFLKGLPIRARQAALSERLATWVRHNPSKTVAAILSTVFVALTATGVWLHTVRLAAANRAANSARTTAEEAVKRLTGRWVERMIKRGSPLDFADRDFLAEVCDQYRSWPLEPDPVGGLRFRAEGLAKIASILANLAEREQAAALYEEAIGILEVCAGVVGDTSVLTSQRLELLEANYELFCYLDSQANMALAVPRIMRLLDDPAARDARTATDRCVVAMAKLNLALATAARRRTPDDRGGDAAERDVEECLRAFDAIAAQAPLEPAVERMRICALMSVADATSSTSGKRALERLRLATTIARRSEQRFAEPGDQDLFSRQYVVALAKQCDVTQAMGDHEASLALARTLVADVRGRSDPDDTADLFYRGEFIEAAIREANALVSVGRAAESEAVLEKAIELATRSAEEQPAVFTHAGRLAKVLQSRAISLLALDRKAEAAATLTRIVDAMRPWQASSGRGEWATETIQHVHRFAGDVMLEAGDAEGAIDEFRKLAKIVPAERRSDAARELLRAGRSAGRLDVVAEAFRLLLKDPQLKAAVASRLGLPTPSVGDADASRTLPDGGGEAPDTTP